MQSQLYLFLNYNELQQHYFNLFLSIYTYDLQARIKDETEEHDDLAMQNYKPYCRNLPYHRPTHSNCKQYSYLDDKSLKIS